MSIPTTTPFDQEMMITECPSGNGPQPSPPPHWRSTNGSTPAIMNTNTISSSSSSSPSVRPVPTTLSTMQLSSQRPSAQEMLKRAGQRQPPISSYSSSSLTTPIGKPSGTSPFIRRPQNNEDKAVKEISSWSITELQDALARNENLMQTSGVAERFGDRLRSHHDLMVKRLGELRGIQDIRVGVENTHISSSSTSDVSMAGTRMDSTSAGASVNISSQNPEDQISVKKEEDADTTTALWGKVEGNSTASRQPPRDLLYRKRMHDLYMRKLTVEPNFQNSRTMFVPVEEALRIETVEALREKEERDRAQARLDRLGKEGLARIRSRAIAEYMNGNIDEDEESYYEDIYGKMDDDDEGSDGGQNCDDETVREDDILESLGQFGQAYMEGYNRKQDMEDDDDESSSRKVKLEDEEFR